MQKNEEKSQKVEIAHFSFHFVRLLIENCRMSEQKIQQGGACAGG